MLLSCILLAYGFFNVMDAVNDTEKLKCAGSVCLPMDYNRLDRPLSEKPVKVDVDLEILQILEVDDLKFTVKFAMYLGVRWQDPRLIKVRPSNLTYEPVDLSFFDHIWIPDLYFYHLKEISTLKVFTTFAGLFVANQSGFFFSKELHITFWCPMRFEKYPLDNQICKFKVGSYAHDENLMVFSHSMLSYDETIRNTILDYSVEVAALKKSDQIFVWNDIGNYSLTGFEMRLNRNSMKYLVNQYLPSGLFVLVSFSSFLIPPEIVPGRMTLLVTLFLVLINIFNNTIATAPNTETMTSVSAWVMACILFVFGALAGYAGILYLLYNRKQSNHANIGQSMNLDAKHMEKLHSQSLRHIDMKLLVGFPVLFLVFNLFYWPMFLPLGLLDSEHGHWLSG